MALTNHALKIIALACLLSKQINLNSVLFELGRFPPRKAAISCGEYLIVDRLIASLGFSRFIEHRPPCHSESEKHDLVPFKHNCSR
jgi:hypothetical protein